MGKILAERTLPRRYAWKDTLHLRLWGLRCFEERPAPRHARKSGALTRLLAVAVCCTAMLCAFRLYSRVRHRFDVRLPVRAVLQNPGLPNGCEATSLAALLNYMGVAANKLDLAYAYIPRGDLTDTAGGRIGPDPERAYAGDPSAGARCPL